MNRTLVWAYYGKQVKVLSGIVIVDPNQKVNLWLGGVGWSLDLA